jgi:hypothetical protein
VLFLFLKSGSYGCTGWSISWEGEEDVIKAVKGGLKPFYSAGRIASKVRPCAVLCLDGLAR